MSAPLFRDDAYLKEAPATVIGWTDDGGLILDRSLFYPTGGGQPGDSGWLDVSGGRIEIATTRKGEGDQIVLILADPSQRPDIGVDVVQRLDWDRRFRHMRIHTALHLLSVVIPLPVTGGQIGDQKGRLDFDMPEAPTDKDVLETTLNHLVMRDLPVTEDWITDAALAANPNLVKTMSVKPPSGQDRIRLIRIGDGADQVDLQPCGGTHVSRTAEIGRLTLGKIEKKGRQNRRVSLHLAE